MFVLVVTPFAACDDCTGIDDAVYVGPVVLWKRWCLRFSQKVILLVMMAMQVCWSRCKGLTMVTHSSLHKGTKELLKLLVSVLK